MNVSELNNRIDVKFPQLFETKSPSFVYNLTISQQKLSQTLKPKPGSSFSPPRRLYLQAIPLRLSLNAIIAQFKD